MSHATIELPDYDFFANYEPLDDAANKPNKIEINTSAAMPVVNNDATAPIKDNVVEDAPATEVQATEETEVTEETPVTEEASKEEETSDAIIAEQAVMATEPEETPKPKRRRGRPKKKKEDTDEAVATVVTEEQPVAEAQVSTQVEAPVVQQNTEEPATVTVTVRATQNYHDIINALDLLPPIDENFLSLKAEVEEKMNKIIVQDGMDRANINVMGQKIDELSAILNANYAAMKTAYENLSNKDDGILARTIIKGSMNGTPYNQSNDMARKANGIVAAENFVSPRTGQHVDLYWAVYATRYAKNFYDAAIGQLENKRRLLKQQADFIINKV